MRTLIVDDAGFMREILIQHCSELGYQVVGEASSGQEAIAQAKKYRPELVIMDLVLPEKNGIEASAEIIQSISGVEILAVTSLNEDELRKKSEAVGCKYFLKKPFTKEELQSVLNKIQKERRNLKHG